MRVHVLSYNSRVLPDRYILWIWLLLNFFRHVGHFFWCWRDCVIHDLQKIWPQEVDVSSCIFPIQIEHIRLSSFVTCDVSKVVQRSLSSVTIHTYIHTYRYIHLCAIVHLHLYEIIHLYVHSYVHFIYWNSIENSSHISNKFLLQPILTYMLWWSEINSIILSIHLYAHSLYAT